jgi:hypothetical protein
MVITRAMVTTAAWSPPPHDHHRAIVAHRGTMGASSPQHGRPPRRHGHRRRAMVILDHRSAVVIEDGIAAPRSSRPHGHRSAAPNPRRHKGGPRPRAPSEIGNEHRDHPVPTRTDLVGHLDRSRRHV